MQNFMFLRLLLSTSLSMSLAVASENNAINVEQPSLQAQSETRHSIEQPQLEIEWPRVKAKFNCVQFLLDCGRKHHELVENINLLERNNNELNELSWKVLFELKDHYKSINDLDNYTFTYQSMAKLLLSYGIYPLFCDNSDKQRDFLVSLIDKIGQQITPNCKKETKLRKWFHIYEGMLFVKYAKDFASVNSSERKNRHLQNAYYEFLEAINLKTTKTTYYLMAELLLDHGFTPEGMTREQAEELAYSYIQQAQPEENKSIHTGGSQSQAEEPSVVEKHAKPAYMSDTGYPQEKQSSLSPAMSLEEISDNSELSPNAGQIQQDPLADYNYGNLIIPHRLQLEGLEIQSHPLNKVGAPTRTYKIRGQKFKLQNVSGDGMRCFFNALGVDPQLQINRMRELKNDPVMRYMIANEIVSAARNPAQIPIQLKQVIDFATYERDQEELDRLSDERGTLLNLQTRNAELQDTSLLPERYQNLRERGEIALEQLRERCLSLAAYEAFIQYHIDTQQMMVTLQDLTENGNNNLSSIDAIAYMNKVGVEIYQPNERGNLRLAHRYIPENATNLTRIYHEGIHFQALVPDTGSWGTIPIQEIGPEDSNFFNNLEEQLNIEGISLEELDPISAAGMYPEIRSLVNDTYGEGVEVHLHVSTDRQPIILATWDAEPETIHFYKVNGQWKKDQEPHQEEEGEAQHIQIPSAKELRRLYPKIETYAGRRTYDKDFVRQVLYARLNLEMSHKEIGELVDLDGRRISDILIANEIRRYDLLPADLEEKLLQTFLQFYKEWVGNQVAKPQIAKAFYQKYSPLYGEEIKEKKILNFLTNAFAKGKHNITKEMADKITSMYLTGKKFQQIRDETSAELLDIIEVLSESINPQDYRNPVNLSVAKKALSESQKETLIIDTFNSLKLRKGSIPNISNVVEALKAYKIGYKTVERILKREGLVKKKIKSEHISFKDQQLIRDEYKRLEATGLSPTKIRLRLASQFKVTDFQIKNLMRGGYSSTGKQQAEENHRRVLEAYYKLTAEQKESHPTPQIAKKIGLSEKAVWNHLIKAGLIKAKEINPARKRKIDSMGTDDTSDSSSKKRKFSESMGSESDSSSRKRKFSESMDSESDSPASSSSEKEV